MSESPFGATPGVAPSAYPDSLKSPIRRQLFMMGTALCGVTVASAIFNPTRADLFAALGNVLYLDSIVLNFACELAELESEFFAGLPTVAAYGSLNEREQTVLSVIAAQDLEHLQSLKCLRDKHAYKASGLVAPQFFKARRTPRTCKAGNLSDRENLFKTALDLKENACLIYQGTLGLLRNKSLLAAVNSIVEVEGRHALVLREVMGLDSALDPLEGTVEAQIAGLKLPTYGFNRASAL